MHGGRPSVGSHGTLFVAVGTFHSNPSPDRKGGVAFSHQPPGRSGVSPPSGACSDLPSPSASLPRYLSSGNQQLPAAYWRPLRSHGFERSWLCGSPLRPHAAPRHRPGADLLHLPGRQSRRRGLRHRRRFLRQRLRDGRNWLDRLPHREPASGEPGSGHRRRLCDEAECRRLGPGLLHLPGRQWS